MPIAAVMVEKPPTIRIETDGSARSTRIFGRDGVELEKVTRVDLSIDVHKPLNLATIHVLDVAGSLVATLEALEVTTLPAPAVEHVVTVYRARWTWRGKRSRLVIERCTNRGTDYTVVEPYVRCWIPATEPLELRFPGEPAVYRFLPDPL